jgi:hypothetical protein
MKKLRILTIAVLAVGTAILTAVPAVADGAPSGVRSSIHKGVRVNFWQGISVTDENGLDFEVDIQG